MQIAITVDSLQLTFNSSGFSSACFSVITIEDHAFARIQVVREKIRLKFAGFFPCVSLNHHLLIASPCCLLAQQPGSLIRKDSPIITSV